MVRTSAQASSGVPSHVPPELVWDHDIHEYLKDSEDPYLALAPFYEGPEILWARGASYGKSAWLPTRHAIINEVMLDPALFSNLGSLDVSELLGEDFPLLPVEVDPPAHTVYRRVVQPWFGPAQMSKLEPTVRQVTNQLMDGFVARGSGDLVEEFTSLLPSHIFLALMGMPGEMLPQFLEWVDGYLRSATHEGRVRAMQSIKAYLEQFADERRRNPRQDDMVSAIITAQVGDRPINREELLGTLILLFLGGLDTVTSSLGWYFLHLAKHPDLQSRLRDNPNDIPGAADDFLRAYGVNQRHRIVTRDTTFHGVPMKKGDWVMTPLYLAGRDPAAYPNPHVVDPDRKARHLTFASGIHICLGMHLAKREVRIVLEEALRRMKNLRIAPGARARWHTAGVWGVSRLPLTWDCSV